MTRSAQAAANVQGRRDLAKHGPQPLAITIPNTAHDAARVQAEGEQILAELKARPIVVRDREHYEEIAGLMNEARDRRLSMTKMLRAAVDPINAGLKVVRGWFTPGVDAWQGVEDELKESMAVFQLGEKKREEAAEKAAAKAAEARDTKALVKALDAVADAGPVKVAGAGVRFRWVLERVVPAMVPEEWKIPDEARAKAHAAAAGSADEIDPIPGFIFKREAIISGSSGR